MSDQVLQQYRHPEWKRLMDEVGPLLEPGVFLSYEELAAFAGGLDMTSTQGRTQFGLFRKAVLKTKRLWLQNDRKKGYHCIQPNEHPVAANDQFSKARRRLKKGREILSFTRYEELTPEERRVNADMLARLAKLEHIALDTHRDVRKLIVATEKRERLPSPLLPDETS